MAAQIQARASSSPRSTFHPPSCAINSSYYQQHTSNVHSSIHDFNQDFSSNQNFADAYMNPILPQPALQYSYQPSSRHGIKRSAPDPDDEFERSSHISTQFKKLRLNNQQRPNSDEHKQLGQYSNSHAVVQSPAHAIQLHDQPNYPSAAHSTYGHEHVPNFASDDFMTIDDTPHKIFIGDLDSEIASIEAAERSSSHLFLPDFEKQIGAIPDHVLRSSPRVYQNEVGESSNAHTQALVLYKDPSSISIPEEEDAVRKAISEARRGIRERMRRQQQRERETANVNLAFSSSRRDSPSQAAEISKTIINAGRYDPSYDGDAMEVE